MGKNAMTSALDGVLRCRISKRELDIFVKKCARINRRPPDMMREFITSFNDGSLTMKKPKHITNMYKD